MFQRVIVPLDGSDLAERALAYGAEIAEKFGAAMTLVRAYEGPVRSAEMLSLMEAQPGPGGIVDPVTINAVTAAAEAAGDEAREYLDVRAQALRTRGITVEIAASDAPPSDAVLEAAAAQPGALVVMSTHGRGGLSRLVFGSVAEDVLHRARVPVLMVRAGMTHADLENAVGQGDRNDMNIAIGDTVLGTDGRLGEVHRVIVDATTDKVTDIVVKHGFIFGGERTVPLTHVTGVEDGAVTLDLDQHGLETMEPYVDDRMRGPDPDYSGAPGFPNEVLDQAVAMGSAAAYAGSAKPLGYPGGEQVSPDDMARPSVAAGTPVFDRNGEKVGEVHELTVAADGAPVRLVIRRGAIFHHDQEIPIEWVTQFGDDGILLSVEKDRVEQHMARS